MAQQEEGWPLGLRPLNARIGFIRNGAESASASFSTLLTASPLSSISSASDLHTESSGYFFNERSITLGSLIGVSSMLRLSRRGSTRASTAETNKKCKSRNWVFSLCSKLSTDAVNTNNNQSLAHFLQRERRQNDLLVIGPE